MSAEPVVWYDLPSDSAASARAVQAFGENFGGEPEGLWAAPGRVNLIGEHVDYNGGVCLPFALPHKTFVALRRTGDGLVRLHSGQQDERWSGELDAVSPGTVHGWAGYAVGVPWALRRAGLLAAPGLGFDAEVAGYVPVGSGLSSSAALECAVAIALDELCELGLGGTDAGRARLAAACVDAENGIARAPTGGMDQAAALRSTAGSALLVDCTDFSVRQVPFEPGSHGLALLVMDTRAQHTLVDGQYGSRRQTCEEAARLLGVPLLGVLPADQLDQALATVRQRIPDPARADVTARRVRHVVTEIARVHEVVALLDAGQVARIGRVLDASHASMRDDFEISCPELDTACDVALAAGALGSRMTGGGFGGSAIALVHADAVDLDQAAVRCARENLAPLGATVLQGDLYRPLPDRLRGRVDLVLASPPYVPTGAIALMPPEARLHEPSVALDGGPDGLAPLRRLAAGAGEWLAPRGHLLVELSAGQRADACSAMADHGLAARVVRSESLDATVILATPC